jgi:hypothetical protein
MVKGEGFGDTLAEFEIDLRVSEDRNGCMLFRVSDLIIVGMLLMPTLSKLFASASTELCRESSGQREGSINIVQYMSWYIVAFIMLPGGFPARASM